MSVALDTLRQPGGELAGVQSGMSVNSTSDDTKYQLERGNGTIDPDYIHDLGDGYALLVDAENRRAVVLDDAGNVWEVWGDPHVTWHNGEELQGAFDFINNMTLELKNGKRVTFETSTDTVNNMTLLENIMVFDPDNTSTTIYGAAGTASKQEYNGQAALAAENGVNDGAEIMVLGGSLESAYFLNEDGSDAGNVWTNKNDITADFAKVKGVQNEDTDILIDPAIIEEMGFDITDETDRDAISLGLLLLVVFQQRQDGIQDFLRIRLDELDGNNAEINQINAILDSVVAGIEGEGENKVPIPKEVFEFLKRTGTVNPGDANIKDHIEYDDNEVRITGSVLKQALTSKAEELQNMSQQMQQQIQFSFSNLTNSSETLTSSLKGYFDMVKSIARNAGG